MYVYSTGEMDRVRLQYAAVICVPIKYAMGEARKYTMVNQPVVYAMPARPVKVYALKLAMYSVMPDIHHGIMLPPVKYCFPPLFTRIKYTPMPSMKRKYATTTRISKILADFIRMVLRGFSVQSQVPHG